MKVLTISVAGCAAILLMSPTANAGGSLQRSVASRPALHSMIAPHTTTFHPYSYVPKSPQNPYATSTGSSSPGIEPYSVPVQPQNPYESSANRSPMTSSPYVMPVVAANSYSAPPSYGFRCIINQTGDYCSGASASPVSTGTACTCGEYNGYTR